jgi:electron transport complex protein RnfG
VGIDRNGEIQGVRVSAHRETPGLGDAIEAKRSDWIHDFEGRSLGNPPAEDWQVRKDGGVFDQFTGATITPRAVVRAVYRTLQYFQQHRDDLLATRPPDTGSGVQSIPQQGGDDQDKATG